MGGGSAGDGGFGVSTRGSWMRTDVLATRIYVRGWGLGMGGRWFTQ